MSNLIATSNRRDDFPAEGGKIMANTQSPNGTKPVELTTKPLPASHKVYVHSHHRPEISVAMRAVVLSNASNGNGHAGHANAPLMIYDTSGPYTDPNVQTDIRQG